MSSLCIKNLKTLSKIEAEKSVTENFVREREKCTNKGTDKQYVADSFIQYNLLLPSFVPNFKILGQVVPEKSLTEKKVYTHTHTHKHYYQCSRMVAGPSDISGNRPLGPENSSPTSDRLSDVKFGTNLDVLGEIYCARKPLLEK